MELHALSNFPLPTSLKSVPSISHGPVVLPGHESAKEVQSHFPKIYGLPELHFQTNNELQSIGRRLRAGIVFAGGTAPGAVEFVTGLYNYLQRWNGASELLGFRRGFKGLIEGSYITIDQAAVRYMLCEGGLGCVGTGVASLNEDAIQAAEATVKQLDLDGLVIVGGSSFITAAMRLADHFVRKNLKTCVIAATKRLEVGFPSGGMVKKQDDISFGFDSVTKLYSFLVGNVAADVQSAQSSYHFIRLMGDEKSGALTLEVALDTHPNVVFINEELQAAGWGLSDLVNQICDVICMRATKGLNYGVVLLPEGVITAVNDIDELLDEITDYISKKKDGAPMPTREDVLRHVSREAAETAKALPAWFLEQMIVERRSHSHEVHHAQMQVEKLFALMCQQELQRRKELGAYVGKFGFQTHFYGYESRAQQPSQFDCQLGNALGNATGALLEKRYTGYLVSMRNLALPVSDWSPVATPLTSFAEYHRGRLRVRHGRVDLDGYPFQALKMLRQGWVMDNYRFSVGTLSDVICTTVQLKELERQHDAVELMRSQEKLKELIAFIKKLSIESSAFKLKRLAFDPPVPGVLRGAFRLEEVAEGELTQPMSPELAANLERLFPATFPSRKAYRVQHNTLEQGMRTGSLLRIGVVLSGGPAPGGHNVISGLYDYLKSKNTDSVLVGFLKGPDGLLNNRAKVITSELLSAFRNQGGFNMIGTSRTKIETAKQFSIVADTVARQNLNGLVICGGDDSNTNAAVLADYFVSNNIPCKVIGMPKTIDADLRNNILEMSFGFDTASKAYSALLANVMQECLVRADRWHFVRLMGRAASHIAVEVALQTHPNYTIVSEEVAAKGRTIMQIVHEIADLVSLRSAKGKDYGTVVVPEGLIEVTRDMRVLISELNELLAKGSSDVEPNLSPESKEVFQQMPEWLRVQLMSERDPHGNVRVSLIESERLLASLVAEELRRRGDPASRTYKFWCHFFGYQGRCALTSNFDCTYCYVLGHLAGCLIEAGATGVIGAIRNLCGPVDEWELVGLPLVSMMTIERRKGKDKPVIEKKLVDLKGPVFRYFDKNRPLWALNDAYPNRLDLRSGHLGGVDDFLPTQTQRLEHSRQPAAPPVSKM